MIAFALAPRGYLMDGLPPVADVVRLERELKLVPDSHRADAIQEAWLAHLVGECPRLAVKRWWMSQLRRWRRESTYGDLLERIATDEG